MVPPPDTMGEFPDFDSMTPEEQMAWLESLAKRQGVDDEELITSADVEIAEVSADAVVDEPGYVPFEGSRSARRMKEDAEAAAQALPPELEPEEWLESLAERQGVDGEEFLTEAAIDIPESSEDTVIDEPGYVDYSPLSISPAEDETELPAEVFEAAEEDDDDLFAYEAGDDSLSWLEDLAAEPDEEFSDMFAEAEEPEPVASVPSGDDPLADLSDEDVARLQAQGQLTPHRELAWLKRQAAKLAEVHHDDEVDDLVLSEADLAPAELGDLPPWLEQMRDQSDDEVAAILAEGMELVEEVELPAGLFEDIEADIDLDVSSLALDTDELSPEEVDSLWAEPVAEEPEIAGPESELAAFLEGSLEPEDDPLAEALDAEYERNALGDDTEPDWYTDAVAKVASEAPAVPEVLAPVAVEPSEFEAPVEPVVAAAVPVDMPDWLKEVKEEAPAAEAEGIPDWLTGEAEIMPAVVGDVPDWLQEQMPDAEAMAVPDWLSEVGEEELLEEAVLDWVPDEDEVAEVVSEPPVPTPVPSPAPVSSSVAALVEAEVSAPAPAAVPQGAQFDEYRQRLETNPNDYTSRLGLARALRDQQQTVPGLDQYETLINASQQLQDVVNDLRGLVGEQAELPRVSRLLGDAFMRQGRLQEALDAYRNALNKL